MGGSDISAVLSLHPSRSTYSQTDDDLTTTIKYNRKASWNTLQRLSAKEGRCGIPAVSRVPHDILREIFEVYHVPGSPVRIPFRQNRPTGPFTFSHVCRDWRDAALATTSVWSSLHIEISQNLGPVRAKSISKLIDLCAGFSARRPLSLRLSIYARRTRGQGESESDPPNPISLYAIWYSILLLRDRWRELYVQATHLALEELVAYGHLTVTQPTPLLQKFYLRGESESDTSRSPFSDTPLFNETSAPLLHTLSLYDDALFWADKQAFPWRQLRELNLGGAYLGLKLEECVEILLNCEGLLRCQLSIRRRVRDGVVPIKPVVLPSLECLEIIDRNLPAQRGDIYRILQCPNLAEVTIKYVEGDDCDDESLLWADEALSNFLGQTDCIWGLHLWGAPVTEQGLLNVLKQHPTISHLTVANGGFDTLFGNRALTELTISPPYVMLQNLAYISIASRRCSGRDIEDFVESRRGIYRHHGVRTLKQLRFNSLGTVLEPSLQCRLRLPCEEGLILEIARDYS